MPAIIRYTIPKSVNPGVLMMVMAPDTVENTYRAVVTQRKMKKIFSVQLMKTGDWSR